jgi:hypothetical protein
MFKCLKSTLLIAGLSVTPGAACAQVVLEFGPGLLDLPSKTETFPVYAVNNGATVQLLGGLLEVQVADGGPSIGGSIVGPAITSVNLFSTGDLFAGNNNGTSGVGAIGSQIFERGTLTATGTVPLAPGANLVGDVSFDLSAFVHSGGQWNLSLDGANGNSALLGSDGNPIALSALDTTITLVPEPRFVSVVFASTAVAASVIVRRLRRAEADVPPSNIFARLIRCTSLVVGDRI